MRLLFITALIFCSNLNAQQELEDIIKAGSYITANEKDIQAVCRLASKVKDPALKPLLGYARLCALYYFKKPTHAKAALKKLKKKYPKITWYKSIKKTTPLTLVGSRYCDLMKDAIFYSQRERMKKDGKTLVYIKTNRNGVKSLHWVTPAEKKQFDLEKKQAADKRKKDFERQKALALEKMSVTGNHLADNIMDHFSTKYGYRGYIKNNKGTLFNRSVVSNSGITVYKSDGEELSTERWSGRHKITSYGYDVTYLTNGGFNRTVTVYLLVAFDSRTGNAYLHAVMNMPGCTQYLNGGLGATRSTMQPTYFR